MKTIVFSLGGSLIVPEEIDLAFLKKFAHFVQKLAMKYKVVVVTGGGKTARKYIAVANRAGMDEDAVSLVGIESTRLNASLVAGFFGTVHALPESLADVRVLVQRERIVVCGALGFMPEMTSDGDAALVAKVVGAKLLVNLTNVKGLYSHDPKRVGAKLIPQIAYKDFIKAIHKIAFKPGQHFVLDHKAAHLIQKHKIRTVILYGKDVENVQRCLADKSFVGTVIG